MTLHARLSDFELRERQVPRDASPALYVIVAAILALALAGPMVVMPDHSSTAVDTALDTAETEQRVIEDWRGNSASFHLAP
ncbi:MAG: hypothetical protein AAF415_01950 [Pseudomonadota bacterium]